MTSVEKISQVQQRLKNAHHEYLINKPENSPSLIAVSKNHGSNDIIPLLDTGHRVFAENRVQEAYEKWPDLQSKYNNIELHLIGPLQTNKVKEAIALFDVIQTVDRPKLAQALAKEFNRTGRHLDCFIQINTGEEEQKSGLAPNEADAFISYCRDDLDLRIIGIMCIPPANEDTAMHFALLKKIARRNNIKGLSMGMSKDFELAAAMGATHVRVGSAIFGKRN